MNYLLAVIGGLALLALPQLALASTCSTSILVGMQGQPITCTTCCHVNALGQQVCSTNCI